MALNYLKYVLLRNALRRNKVSPFCWISGDCELARGVTLRHGTSLSAINGVISIASRTWVDNGVRIVSSGRIEVGSDCTINRRSTISGSVRIGNDCLISPHVFVASGTHKFRSRHISIKDQDRKAAKQAGCVESPNDSEIIIGNDVWLGYGCVVLPGVTVGNGAVVGANAVVTRDIAAYDIVAGVPAGKVGERQ